MVDVKVATGWYGVPGERHATKTHVVLDEKPLCGFRLRPKSEFQWCSGGVWLSHVECATCKKLAAPLQAAIDEMERIRKSLADGTWRKRNDRP